MALTDAEIWLRLAGENIEASAVMRARGNFRSAVSRAYYAAHHAAHALLLASGVKAPSPRGNWKHGALPGEVRSSIRNAEGDVSQNARWADYFHQCLQDCYNLRVQADYKPFDTVDDAHARDSLRLARALTRQAQETLNG